jgi:hypothetical protein
MRDLTSVVYLSIKSGTVEVRETGYATHEAWKISKEHGGMIKWPRGLLGFCSTPSEPPSLSYETVESFRILQNLQLKISISPQETAADFRQQPAAPTQANQQRCPDCPKYLRGRNALISHQRKVHKGGPKCVAVGCYFSSSYLREHNFHWQSKHNQEGPLTVDYKVLLLQHKRQGYGHLDLQAHSKHLADFEKMLKERLDYNAIWLDFGPGPGPLGFHFVLLGSGTQIEPCQLYSEAKDDCVFTLNDLSSSFEFVE